jgi:hypothetical protein
MSWNIKLEIDIIQIVALNPTPKKGRDSFVFSTLNLVTTKNLYNGNTNITKKIVINNG